MELKYILHNCHFEREKKLQLYCGEKDFPGFGSEIENLIHLPILQCENFVKQKTKIYIFTDSPAVNANSLYILHYIHYKDICHWAKIILESSIRLKGELCAQTDEFNLFWLVKQIITIYIYI